MEDIQFNKKKVKIIGAGGLGRELLSWLLLDKKFIEEFELVGFLDDNLNSLDGFDADLKIIDKISIDALNNSEFLLLAISDINIKKRIIEISLIYPKLKLLSYRFTNVVIGSYSTLGMGVVLSPFVVISCNVEIGRAVFINSGSQIGHDAKIGNYVSIMANVDIGGGAIIEDEVFIGSGAVILPHVVVPKGTRIGAGSVVVRNIKKAGTYFGNPATQII